MAQERISKIKHNATYFLIFSCFQSVPLSVDGGIFCNQYISIQELNIQRHTTYIYLPLWGVLGSTLAVMIV